MTEISSSKPPQHTGSPTKSTIVNKPVHHVHKLEKKHSSGDLHSRLKTRKLLGVGETDDGDVHRSKLSQILGHSEQLYIRLPRGLRVWQMTVATVFTSAGLWALLFPLQMFSFALGEDSSPDIILPIRLYGSALISMSVLFWSNVHSTDKDVIRWSLLGSAFYFMLQFIVWLLCCPWSMLNSIQAAILVVCPVFLISVPSLYLHGNVGVLNKGINNSRHCHQWPQGACAPGQSWTMLTVTALTHGQLWRNPLQYPLLLFASVSILYHYSLGKSPAKARSNTNESSSINRTNSEVISSDTKDKAV